MKKPIVYVDLDDTAVDYTNQVKTYKALYPKYQFPQSIIGFFSTIKPKDGFLSAWEELSKYYDMRFLTRPSLDNLNSYTEKAIWVRDNMGVEVLDKLNLCPDKSIVIGDYLIDDFDCHGQKNFCGEFIHFGKDRFKNWQMVVDYLLKKQKDD